MRARALALPRPHEVHPVGELTSGPIASVPLDGALSCDRFYCQHANWRLDFDAFWRSVLNWLNPRRIALESASRVAQVLAQPTSNRGVRS